MNLEDYKLNIPRDALEAKKQKLKEQNAKFAPRYPFPDEEAERKALPEVISAMYPTLLHQLATENYATYSDEAAAGTARAEVLRWEIAKQLARNTIITPSS